MSFYLFLYFVVSILLLIIGLITYKKYGKLIYGKYFLLFSISYFIWLLLYVFSFTFIYEKDQVLILSRFMYGLSFLGLFSMLMIVIFFNSKEKKIQSIYHLLVLFSVFVFFVLISFSNFIIKDLLYNNQKNIFYEELGIGYSLYTILSFITPILLILFSIIKFRKLSIINKTRFFYIIFGFHFLVINEVIFLAILPAFNIWLLQKEQILFFLPLICLSFYSINKYYFINIKLGLGRLFVIICSISGSIFLTSVIKYYFFTINQNLKNFWGLVDNYYLTEMFLLILLYSLLYINLNKLFLGNTQLQQIEKQLSKLKSELPYISNFPDLNSFLKLKFNQIFKIKYVEVVLINDENKYVELVSYFRKEKMNNIFVNDIVFIEENKNKFDKNKIYEEINSESYLIMPLYNNKLLLIGFLNIGQKPFGDIYYTEEINLIKDFANYISGHLKYLRIYDRINDLNINLDKLVDKKTMEYNALVNKQKDFISFVSHEIKGPIGSSIFQVDGLLDDVEDGKTSKGYLKKELELLNNQLIKIGDLTNKIFSIEKYDIGKVKLTKEKVHINDLISNEISVFVKNNENIEFIVNLDLDIGFLELDKVQMLQVINNLLTNAVKFASKGVENPKIAISTYKKGSNIYIEIEDNGKEFEYTNIASLFEKYTTGKGSSIGLGMGLYLCKKIVEMHNGGISAENSYDLGGAKFVIILPKKN